MLRHRSSRRALLACVAAAAALPLAPACAPAAPPTPTAAPKPAEPSKPAEPTKPAEAAKPTAAAAATTAPTAPAAAKPATPAGQTTLKLMSSWWAEKGRDGVLRSFVQKFMELNPGVKIQETGFPNSEYTQKVMTQIAGGQLDGDVLLMVDGAEYRLTRTGTIAPLDDVVDRAKYRPYLIPAHSAYTYNGKLYGLLAVQAADGIIVNKELWEKNGVTKPPTTQDEYVELAKKMTRAPDLYGHAFRTTVNEGVGFFRDMTPWLIGYGGIWSVDKKPKLTEEPVLKMLTTYKTLADSAIPKGADASTYRRMAAEGKVAEHIDNNTLVNLIQTLNPAITGKIGSQPLPWASHKSVTFPTGWGIYAKTGVLDTSKDFLAWMFTLSTFQEWTEKSLDLPMFKEAASPAYLEKIKPWADGFMTTVSQPFNDTMDGFQANIPEFRDVVVRHFSAVILTGRKPEEAMKAAQADLEELAKRVVA
jgi:multiple sugar transport system substrate-binding protein